MHREIVRRLNIQRLAKQRLGSVPVPVVHRRGAGRDGHGFALPLAGAEGSGGCLPGLRHHVERGVHAQQAEIQPRDGLAAGGGSVFRPPGQGLVKTIDGAVERFSGLAVQVIPAAKIPVIRLEIVGSRRRGGPPAGRAHAQHVHDLPCDLVLHGEYIVDVAIITSGPELVPIGRTDALSIYA